MNRIVHIALKVNDLEQTTRFYQEVFGFTEEVTSKVRDHTSRHLSVGDIDFALIRYDEGADSRESKASGEGPCIHHFAIEVDDIDASTRRCLASPRKSRARPYFAPPERRRHRFCFDPLRRGGGFARVEGLGRGPVHPPFRDRSGRTPTPTRSADGCEIVSEPGVVPVKFRAPGGTVAELVPAGRYERKTAKG